MVATSCGSEAESAAAPAARRTQGAGWEAARARAARQPARTRARVAKPAADDLGEAVGGERRGQLQQRLLGALSRLAQQRLPERRQQRHARQGHARVDHDALEEGPYPGAEAAWRRLVDQVAHRADQRVLEQLAVGAGGDRRRQPRVDEQAGKDAEGEQRVEESGGRHAKPADQPRRPSSTAISTPLLTARSSERKRARRVTQDWP